MPKLLPSLLNKARNGHSASGGKLEGPLVNIDSEEKEIAINMLSTIITTFKSDISS